ncbi:MAG: hemolysin family protein [bacterium]|nr:hemolysin family protein [bacterium]
MDIQSIFQGICLIILLFLSAFFSGIEIAFMELNKFRIKNLVDKNPKTKKLLFWLKNPHKVLTVIAICNNFVNIAASAIATSIAITIAAKHGMTNSAGVGISVGVMTFLILVFGEITPKNFAKINYEALALFAITPVRILTNLLMPVVRALLFITKIIIRMFGGRIEKEPSILTGEELKSLISVGKEEGAIEEEEKEMINSIFEFSDTIVREVMVPRTDIQSIYVNESISEVIKKIVETRHSRIPIYEKNIDNIIGILCVKDLILRWESYKQGENIALKDLMRAPYFVPETKKAKDLFTLFKKKKTHMAIVVDEYGGTAGLVTIEDVIEEILGEIEDEHDREEDQFQDLGNGVTLIDGRTNIDAVNEELDIQIPQGDDHDSIAGFIVNRLGRVPKTGEIVNYKNLKIVIAEAGPRHVSKIKIARLEPKKENKNE